jgi:hypothetical protein
MKKEVLLTYFAIGPTFRERVLYNILNNLSSYVLVDLLILTDRVEDFEVLSKYGSIKVINLDDLRRNHPWSNKYEALPIVTRNDVEYAKDILDNSRSFSFALWRFVLLLDNIETYRAIFFSNCDVLFYLAPENYEDFLESLNFSTNDIAIGNGIVNYSGHFKEIAEHLAKEYSLESLESLICSNDGNLFGYCFKNKTKLKQLFELIDRIIYKTLVEGCKEYWQLGRHGIWSTNNEPIQAIAHSLLNIHTYPGSYDLYKAFKINTYPEDRSWSWCTGPFKSTPFGKQHFININYDDLKNMYAAKQQPWIYSK